ncbi:MAG TPA: ribonuclease III [Candidatus Acidoferrum sp.]|nr:ribonuclease III [Candidatus Acidoferrum sp.]
MTNKDEQFEDRLGHKFQNHELLRRALTHSSVLPELRAADAEGVEAAEDNEQLEFLGDAVLDLLASEYLLEKFPKWSEGQLSKSRARLVNAQALELAARRLHVGEHLRLGRGEEKTGGREKPALLADAFEAVVAAIYLDAGLAAAKEMLRTTLFESLEERGSTLFETDRKSALQEFLQGRGKPPAEYRLAAESGPDHHKTFQVEVWINGSCMASGQGSTKKEAEQRAAGTALERLEQTAVRS